jgi:myo-inositol-1-phosphate synthase
MSELRVGIVGVGNCASALVQGRYLYEKADPDDPPPGLRYPELFGYHVSDLRFTAAFDVAANKVGLDLWEAIRAEPNNHPDYGAEPENGMTGITVAAGPRLDGIGQMAAGRVSALDGFADVVAHLADEGTEVLVNYLPVGSRAATEFYADAALEAGCSFVNCIPVPLARNDVWRERFSAAGLVLLGDDVKSQVGATIVHRRLAELTRDRGVRLDRTYQLNVGGNMDFYNMLERGRLGDKRQSKTAALTDVVPLAPDDVHIGPSDYISWLGDRKVAFIRLEATGWGDLPLVADVRLEVWDSSNSAGVVVDAIRTAGYWARTGDPETAALAEPWLFKAPSGGSASDDDARGAFEDLRVLAGA